MAKMINTKYGYVTPQEAEMDAHLDKWVKRRYKRKRRKQHAKNKKMPLS
ncbi:hypothetical protein [Lactiplantibacillus plantarum]|nr:hypothetical protein [Lactiplantibacillus plantarum]MBA3077006.1 hypothetical protein [Lactiplantibacillus plantarum]MBA3081291.1 hypothetical protein [Lactiplantibacillus plantarum]MBA3082806.1 hypothetical protein [Lactiplantibacillus plantarum]MCG0771617.1 putative prophage protein [Lactiplantibacillus plantarum]MDT4760812.1 hypothetical protein [Lactiplantibacillus plantarum]